MQPSVNIYASLTETKEHYLLYTNLKEAYLVSPLPPLDKFDHNMAHLQPKYIPDCKQANYNSLTIQAVPERPFCHHRLECVDGLRRGEHQGGSGVLD